jgi:serine/threonine protein kinase
MTLFPGTRLGPYEVVAPIGAGGMGEVYRAKDTRLDRTVAVKILPAHLSSSADSRQRFEREARTISQLSHPHICALEGERLVTDSEVFQELLHRYAAIQRLDAIEPAFEALLGSGGRCVSSGSASRRTREVDSARDRRSLGAGCPSSRRDGKTGSASDRELRRRIRRLPRG